MYKKSHIYKLGSTVSSLNNNLDVLASFQKDGSIRNISIACINKNQVLFMDSLKDCPKSFTKVISEKPEDIKSQIFEAKWCRINKLDVFVVANYEGVLIYDSVGEDLLFWHSIQPNKRIIDYNIFCRGIVSVDGRFLCIGCSDGRLLQFTCNKNTFQLYRTLTHHKTAITTVAFHLGTEHVNLASGDDSGMICCYMLNTSGQCDRISETESEGIPCTNITLTNNDIMIASFLTGHINIYNSMDGIILVNILAHTGVINSIHSYYDVTTKHTHFLSVSEDSFIRMWTITQKPKLKVEQVWYTSIVDKMPVGVKFIGKKKFLVSCYDSNEVIQFEKC